MPFPHIPPENPVPPGSHPYDSFYHRPRFNVFYALTGFTFAAFAMSFSTCLFQMDQVQACVDKAEYWVGILGGLGQHIIEWSIAFIKAAMH